jgi:hypothetical protein
MNITVRPETVYAGQDFAVILLANITEFVGLSLSVSQGVLSSWGINNNVTLFSCYSGIEQGCSLITMVGTVNNINELLHHVSASSPNSIVHLDAYAANDNATGQTFVDHLQSTIPLDSTELTILASADNPLQKAVLAAYGTLLVFTLLALYCFYRAVLHKDWFISLYQEKVIFKKVASI